jgi:membrane protein
MLLKPVRTRRLRDGAWVVVAEESEPLVVSEAVAKVLQGQNEASDSCVLSPLVDTLLDAGFTKENSTEIAKRPPGAPLSIGWKTARVALWMSGAVFFVSSVTLFLHNGIPTGVDVISPDSHPLLTVVTALGIALATAVPHEFAHIVFGNVLGHRRVVRVRVHRALATTSLTHVWAWPLSQRLAAVAAGIIVDLAFLALALGLRTFTGSWIATTAVSVMVIRILWQFRFHRNCDGRHIAKMLLDDPLISLEIKQIATSRLRSAPHAAWGLALVAVGALAELTLLTVWFIPAVLRLVGML